MKSLENYQKIVYGLICTISISIHLLNFIHMLIDNHTREEYVKKLIFKVFFFKVIGMCVKDTETSVHLTRIMPSEFLHKTTSNVKILY